MLNMLAVVNAPRATGPAGPGGGGRVAERGDRAGGGAGLVDWSPHEPACPVVIRHALDRDAIYAGLTANSAGSCTPAPPPW